MNATKTLLTLTCALLLAACTKPDNSYNKPLSYWAIPTKDIMNTDHCTYKTAQAIIDSGLPYPNITTKEVIDKNGNKKTINDTFDVWVNSTRLVMPAAVMRTNDLYGTNHPYRYHKLSGSLPHFYPAGKPGPEIDGMGSMVDISIGCSYKEDFFGRDAIFSKWDNLILTRDDGIARSKENYEKYLKKSTIPGKVTVSIREDLGMIEVLSDIGKKYNPKWEASYWPIKEDLKGFDGQISGIYCSIRHDPEKRYGKIGWTCGSNFRLNSDNNPDISVGISIYVSQIKHMPAIFKQVKQLFLIAKKNGQLKTEQSIKTTPKE